MKIALLIMLAVVAAGCIQLALSEQEKITELEALGIDPACVGSKTPVASMAGNLFFGFGDLENGQAGLFTLDLLTWPISILWAPWIAYDQAKILNQKETLDYLYATTEGRAWLDGVRAGTIDPKKTRSPRQIWIEDIWATRTEPDF